MIVRLLILSAWLLGFWSQSGEILLADDMASVSRNSEAGQPASTTSSTVEPRNPRVVIITEKGNDECHQVLTRLRRVGGDFETMTSAGWKIGETPDNHIQILDRSQCVELVEKLGVDRFPTVACISDGEIVRAFTDGCTTPLDSWTLSWLYKGKDERPTPVKPEPIRVATSGNYPLRGNHWSVDGIWNPSRDLLVNHLRGPVHVSQIAATWQIESWEYEELRSLHDDLHEREMGGVVPGFTAAQTNIRPGTDSSNARRFYGKF